MKIQPANILMPQQAADSALQQSSHSADDFRNSLIAAEQSAQQNGQDDFPRAESHYDDPQPQPRDAETLKDQTSSVRCDQDTPAPRDTKKPSNDTGPKKGDRPDSPLQANEHDQPGTDPAIDRPREQQSGNTPPTKGADNHHAGNGADDAAPRENGSNEPAIAQQNKQMAAEHAANARSKAIPSAVALQRSAAFNKESAVGPQEAKPSIPGEQAVSRDIHRQQTVSTNNNKLSPFALAAEKTPEPLTPDATRRIAEQPLANAQPGQTKQIYSARQTQAAATRNGSADNAQHVSAATKAETSERPARTDLPQTMTKDSFHGHGKAGLPQTTVDQSTRQQIASRSEQNTAAIEALLNRARNTHTNHSPTEGRLDGNGSPTRSRLFSAPPTAESGNRITASSPQPNHPVIPSGPQDMHEGTRFAVQPEPQTATAARSIRPDIQAMAEELASAQNRRTNSRQGRYSDAGVVLDRAGLAHSTGKAATQATGNAEARTAVGPNATVTAADSAVRAAGQQDKASLEEPGAPIPQPSQKPQQANAQAQTQPRFSEVMNQQWATSDSSVVTPAGATAPARASAAQPAPLTEQITANLSSNVQGNTREITVQLNPPELGRVRIEFQNDGDAVRGVVHVENSRTLSDLSREAPALIERLTEAGIQVRNLEFQMNTDGREDSQAQTAYGSFQQSNNQGGPGHEAGSHPDDALPGDAENLDGSDEEPPSVPEGEYIATGAVNVMM